MLEGAGKVRLIEIAGQVGGVDDGDALFQEVRRISGALNLTKGGVGQSRGPQKMPLCGSQRQVP